MQLLRHNAFSNGLPNGWVDVTHYGAKGDGSTMDDPAFATAIATGAHVYVPPGTPSSKKIYPLANTIIPAAGQHILFGCAMREDIAALSQATETFAPQADSTGYVLFRGQANWAFQQTGSWSRIEGCHVYQDPNYVPSAGGHFRQGGGVSIPYTMATRDSYFANLQANFASWQACFNGAALEPQLYNCKSQNAYIGFQLDGAVIQSNLENVQFSNAVLANIHIDTIQPFGDLHWNKVMTGWGYRTTYGLYVRGLDTSVINNLTLKGGNRYIHFAADNAEITNVSILGANFENCVNGDTTAGGTAGADIITFGGGAYTVFNCRINGAWISAPGLIRLAANTTGCGLIGGNLSACGYIDLGSKNRLIGNEMDGTGPLTAIDLRGTNGVVSGNILNAYALALNLAAAANYYAISGNNLRSNTTISTMDVTAKATGRGSANIGLADW